MKFIEVYNGNGTESARIAGYKGDATVLAQVAAENLRKPHIRDAIDARTKTEIQPHVATRTERQILWTEIMNDKYQSMLYRLRASELLAKSEGDFVVRIEASKIEDSARVVLIMPANGSETVAPENETDEI